jgi:exodeoxyribonuclease-1
MRFVQAAAVYSPSSLSIPINDKGRQTLRLDQLAPANGFAHDDAHEAIADVEATIHIARIIKERAPEVWENLLGTCRKADAVKLSTDGELHALTEFYYGREHTFPVVHCGSNPDYDAQVGVFDLRRDPGAYLRLGVGDLIGILEASPKVIRTVRANAQPILMPLSALPNETRSQFPSDDIMTERAEAIRSDLGFRERVCEAMSGRYADREPAAHLEQRIYDGFPDRADKALMEQFQQADWLGRKSIAERLTDKRIREYARRLIYMNAPEVLSDGARAEMDAWIRDRVLTKDATVPWNTIPKALQETDDLLASATDSDAAFLNDVRSFLEEMSDQFSLP